MGNLNAEPTAALTQLPCLTYAGKRSARRPTQAFALRMLIMMQQSALPNLRGETFRT